MRKGSLIGAATALIAATLTYSPSAAAEELVYSLPIALAPCGATGATTDCIESVAVVSDSGTEQNATAAPTTRGQKNYAVWDGRGTKSAELPLSNYVWDLPGVNNPDSGSKTFVDVQLARDTWGSSTISTLGTDERAMAPVLRIRLTPAYIDTRCAVVNGPVSAYTEDLLIQTPGITTPSNVPFPCETNTQNNTISPEFIGMVKVSNSTTFLPRTLDSKMHVKVTFKVTDFDVLGWIGHAGQGSSASVSKSGDISRITLDLKAVQISNGPLVYSSTQNAYVDPDKALQDSWSIDAFAPLNTLTTCFSGNLAIFTNSRTLELPVFDPVSREVELATSAPHLTSTGEVNTGFYQANIGDQEAKCLWQVDTAAKLAGQAVISITDGDSNEKQTATLSTSLKNNILTVSGGGFHYSAPKLKLKLNSPAATTPAAKPPTSTTASKPVTKAPVKTPVKPVAKAPAKKVVPAKKAPAKVVKK